MPTASSIVPARSPSHGIRMRRVRIPVRDGIHLNGAVYLPRSGPDRVPVCMELTPYTVDLMHDVGQRLAREGFGYLVVDVRGRGDSEGDFRQFIHDARDGVDIVEWITQQPWSDGRVILTGGSYTGLNQWLILGEGHPAIVAATPGAAPAVGFDFPRGGVPNLHNATWESLVWGHTLNGMSGADRGLWVQEVREALEAGRPITSVGDPFALRRDTDWLRFLLSPDMENFADMQPAESGLRGSTVPVLPITGTHDFCMRGTIYHWKRYTELASQDAIARSHLVVGPWDHAGTGTGVNAVGTVQFDNAARVDIGQLCVDWYRHILFGGPLPEFLGDRFVYYVAGTEEWKTAPSMQAATIGTHALGLRSTKAPNDVFHSGWLAEEPGSGPDYSMTFDPADRRVLDIESRRRPADSAAMGDPSFPLDLPSLQGVTSGADPCEQVFSIAIDGDGLVYHSRALDAPLTLVGIPALRLVVVPDRPDVDLAILLHEVRPDGSALFLSAESMRLSHALPEGADVRVGDENTVEFDDLRFISRTIGAGSRVRLTLRSAWSSMNPSTVDGVTGEPITLIVRHGPDTTLTLPLGESR